MNLWLILGVNVWLFVPTLQRKMQEDNLKKQEESVNKQEGMRRSMFGGLISGGLGLLFVVVFSCPVFLVF